MNLRSQKKVAARILKCGESRVRVKSDKKVEEALTREDIRNLIKEGLIHRVQKKGTSKKYSKKLLEQKKKGRKRGTGKKKGKKGAKNPGKKIWMNKIRPIRDMLKELRDNKKITKSDYRTLYLRAKGGMFRNKKHLLYYMKDHGILKEKKKK